MKRREFLQKAFNYGGIAALVSLGVSHKEANALVVGYSRTVGGGGPAISENFDAGTNFSTISGTPIFDGTYTVAAWGVARSRHTTDLGSANHWVQADLVYDGVNDAGELLMRVNAGETDYYKVTFESNGEIRIRDAGGAGTIDYDGSYGAGTYTVYASCNGTNLIVKVDTVEVINATDSNVAAGNFVGVGANRDNSAGAASCDIMTGDAL